jgi:hypothetical protein
MRRRGLLSQLGAVLQGQSVPLDDPYLARDFVVQADDPFKIRLLFANPRILELIYAQPVLRLEAPPQADELILEVEGASASMQQVERLFDLFAEALYQLCDLGVADHAAAAAPHPAPESPSETVACFFCGRALAPADARETALAIRHAPLRVLVCGQHAVALASGQRPPLRARSVAGRLEP